MKNKKLLSYDELLELLGVDSIKDRFMEPCYLKDMSTPCGFYISRFVDRFYLGEMFSDRSLIDLISSEQKEILTKNLAYGLSATISGTDSEYIMMDFQQWGLGRSKGVPVNTMITRQKIEGDLNITNNAGLVFHVIQGKLYAYSRGDARKNPELFISLINDLVSFFDLKCIKYRITSKSLV